MPAETAPFDVVVLGAGLRGLTAALRTRRQRPHARLLVVDAAPQPGGSVRTQRTNGFVCELGPFAFGEADLAPLLALLERPPVPIPCLEAARTGHLFTGGGLIPIPVDPAPVSFRSGNEELVQACRRELGSALQLGRAAAALDHDGRFQVTLAGEVPTGVRADELVVALPLAAASRLLGRFDPSLANAAGNLTEIAGAMAFFGGAQASPPPFAGFGIAPAAGVASPLVEGIHCSEVFPGRALPQRFLVRAEVAEVAAGASDDDVLATAEAELRRWTGCTAAFGLRKLHRFARDAGDGAAVECRIRLRDLAARVPGLHLA